MAALVPTSTSIISLGNKVGIRGRFTSISDNDTWAPGLSTVEAAYVENGQSGQTHGTTYSGGTVTVRASAGMANIVILAIGT